MCHAIIQLLMIKTNSLLSTPDVSCYHTTIDDKDKFIAIYPKLCYHTTIDDKDKFIAIYPWHDILSYNYLWWTL